MFERLLVTGDQGFVGRHALRQWPTAVGLSALVADADIRNKASLVECLRGYRPDAVVHLAALSFVPDSFRSPEATFEVNFLGTLRLLEALAETGFSGRLLFVGSGDTYGLVPIEALPISEEFVLRPRNPYAVSKVAAEALCYQWSQTGPFEVVMARPFNHIGAGQEPTFVISDFARQVAQIAAGVQPALLQVGDIDVTRDFTDVGDVLRAYALLLADGHNGESYNVCSGVERSVRSLLESLLELSGVEAKIVNDPARLRPTQQQRIFGSHKKLSQHTLWQPEVPMAATLLNLYHYWENEIGR